MEFCELGQQRVDIFQRLFSCQWVFSARMSTCHYTFLLVWQGLTDIFMQKKMNAMIKDN
jgi:hypothetical protein